MLGGGPAGCAAARLLAAWGHRVVLAARPSSGPELAESLPPSTQRLLDVLGVRAAVDAAGFVRSTGNTVWWGGEAPRVEQFAGGGRGWQITAHAFETLLRNAAMAAGAIYESGAPSMDDAQARGAAFVLDATGRSGVFARGRRLRVQESKLRTVALAGRWRARVAFELPDPTHTVIESYDNGWTWSVPVSTCERCVAVMVDPRSSRLARGAGARDVYLAEIARTRHTAAILRDAVLDDGPGGWDAAMYSARRYVDGNVLLVGDAGSFIDPLSSAGVKKALASGWLAAVAVHTSLTRPSMREVALAFFATREAEVYAAFRTMTARFLADAAAGHTHPFWNDRTDVEPVDDDEHTVAAAFEHLRAQPALRVAPSRHLRVEPRAAVSGNEIVLEPRLVSDRRPQGVRHIAGVDLLPLVRLAPVYTSVPDLFEAYNAEAAPVDLPSFLRALSGAIAGEWLVWV